MEKVHFLTTTIYYTFKRKHRFSILTELVGAQTSKQSPGKRSDRHRAVDYKYKTAGLREGSLSRETWPNFSSFFSHGQQLGIKLTMNMSFKCKKKGLKDLFFFLRRIIKYKDYLLMLLCVIQYLWEKFSTLEVLDKSQVEEIKRSLKNSSFQFSSMYRSCIPKPHKPGEMRPIRQPHKADIIVMDTAFEHRF